MRANVDIEAADVERQIQRDLDTLRVVIPGLEELERRWNDARLSVEARERGYFTPDEDDRVRQMLLAYRNYRIALYEIIFRASGFREVEAPDVRYRLFLAGFAAGLTVFSKSLKLIQAYEREPLIRRKLNEPDAKFELAEGFFEELLHAYSSAGNYRDLARGVRFWRQHRRAIQEVLDGGHPEWKWTVELIGRERAVIGRRLVKVLFCRLRYDWRTFVSTVLRPVRRTRYGLQALIGGAGAKLRTTGHYRPALKPSHIARLQAMLRPGDVVLVRAEKKLTSAILPGFWAHAMLYIGGPSELEELGAGSHPQVQKQWAVVAGKSKGHGCVIEAISPAVQIESLTRALFVDHALVVRPRLEKSEVAQAVAEGFGHVGKAYDFEFDFNVTTRIVCTELIYRCYHHRGRISFPLIKRLGRFTLSGDDIADLLSGPAAGDSGEGAGFELVCLALSSADGQVKFLEPAGIVPALRRIRLGWKPANDAEPAHG